MLGLQIVAAIKAVAWPLAAIILALIVKPEIGALTKLLGRVRQLELPGGVKATIDSAERQLAKTDNPVDEKLTVNETLSGSAESVLGIIEERLKTDLQKVDPDKRQAVLLRSLAQTRIERGHEYIYNRIFGSQIEALKQLNTVSSATVGDARKFLMPYVEQYSEFYKSYSFENWLLFLVNNGLVKRQGDTLEISEFGRDFLVYLSTARLTEAKFF